MARTLLIISLVFIAVGLVLLVYPDPQFRAIFNGGTNTGGFTFPTTGFRFNGTIPRNFTFPGGAGNITRRFGGGGGAAALINTNSEIESLIGAGLVSVGVVFVAIELFLMPSRVK